MLRGYHPEPYAWNYLIGYLTDAAQWAAVQVVVWLHGAHVIIVRWL